LVNSVESNISPMWDAEKDPYHRKSLPEPVNGVLRPFLAFLAGLQVMPCVPPAVID
jgi:hypothetical protein